MKKIILSAAFASLTASCAICQEGEIVSFVANGREYSGVKVQKVWPDALQVVSSSGIARIPFEQLPADLQLRFKFDASKATQERQKRNQENQKRIELQQIANQEAQAKHAEIAAREELLAKSQHLEVTVIQVLNDGILVDKVRCNQGYHHKGPQFLSCDMSKYRVVDGDRLQCNAVLMQETYSYESVIGVQKTINKWVVIE